MQAPLTEPAPVETRVSAKVRAVGNSLGIIIPKKVLQNIGIGKGDDIVIDIDIELLRRQKRIALIEELKGSLKHLRGDEPWDCSDTDVDEVDKPEYKELLD